MTRGSRYRVLALLAVTVIILDQATKYWIMQTMRLHESIPIIPNLFSFTYIRNPGAAFGLLANSSNAFRTVFFGVTALLALALLGTILVRLPEKDWVGQLSIAGIVGGAIGNLIDRLRFGEVIDFLDAYVIGPNFQFRIDHYQLGSLEIGPYLVDLSGPHHWPAFNVADSAISVGVVCLIIHFAFERKEAPLSAAETTPTTGG